MEEVLRAGRGARRPTATPSPPRPCSSRTRPTRRPAAAAPSAEIHALREVVRRRRRPARDRQHQGLHRPPDGRRDRGRRRRQGARDRHRAAGPELQGGRPGAGRAEPVEGRRLPGPLRAAAGGRLRLADQHDAAALDARWPTGATATPRSSATPTGSPTRRRGRPGCARSAARRRPSSRSCSGGCGSSTAAAAAPARPPRRRSPRRLPVAPLMRGRRRRTRRPPAPAVGAGRCRRWRSGPASGCWRWSPSRPATRRTCWTSTSISRPTSGSTRSSRRRCSRRSASSTGSNATTR